MTRTTIKKIVKITLVLVMCAIATTLTSCSTANFQATRANSHKDDSYSINTYILENDMFSSISNVFKFK